MKRRPRRRSCTIRSCVMDRETEHWLNAAAVAASSSVACSPAAFVAASNLQGSSHDGLGLAPALSAHCMRRSWSAHCSLQEGDCSVYVTPRGLVPPSAPMHMAGAGVCRLLH